VAKRDLGVEADSATTWPEVLTVRCERNAFRRKLWKIMFYKRYEGLEVGAMLSLLCDDFKLSGTFRDKITALQPVAHRDVALEGCNNV